MRWRAVVLVPLLGTGCKAPPPAPAPAASASSPAPSPSSSPEFRSPKRIKHVDPIYPEAARAARREGDVVVELEISKTGKVTRAEVVEHLTPDFDRAATEAVMQWEYTPTIYKGEPALMYLTVTVRFRLPK